MHFAEAMHRPFFGVNISHSFYVLHAAELLKLNVMLKCLPVCWETYTQCVE